MFLREPDLVNSIECFQLLQFGSYLATCVGL